MHAAKDDSFDLRLTPSERVAAAFWEHRQRALLQLLRRDVGDGFHNHGGLSDFQRALLLDASQRESRLLAEMHRLESAQCEYVLSLLGDVRSSDRILDAGSGRGGTSLAAYQRFGCLVDGVDIAAYQVSVAKKNAADSGCTQRVRFHQRSLTRTGFSSQQFDRVVLNEASMYVDLDEAFAEIQRVLRPGGSLVLIGWCRNDAQTDDCHAATIIDANYVCRTHCRSEYFLALSRHGLSPRTVVDLTKQALPYFELREQIAAIGSEDSADAAFRSGYRSGSLQYFAVVADRVRKGFLTDSQVQPS